MYCLKCGRDSSDVFCEQCRQTMDQYPVKPGTPVSMPDREAYFAQKKAQQPKRKATAEEQLVQARKLLKALFVLLGITLAALAVFILLWIFF